MSEGIPATAESESFVGDPDAVAVEQELSQVSTGEEAQPETQRPEWLPEKFSSVEDMAKAYSELEKKLGQKKPDIGDLKVPEAKAEDVPEEDTKAEEKPDDGTPRAVLGDELFQEITQHWEQNGALNEELYTKLSEKGLSRNVVDSFIEGQALKAERYNTEVTEVVGGLDTYSHLQQWAVDNLSDAEKDALNDAVTSGSVAKAQMAILGLKAKYEANEGKPPKLVEGQAAASTGSVFHSQEEFVQALSDKRYGKDVVYTREVDEKLARSTYWQ